MSMSRQNQYMNLLHANPKRNGPEKGDKEGYVFMVFRYWDCRHKNELFSYFFWRIPFLACQLILFLSLLLAFQMIQHLKPFLFHHMPACCTNIWWSLVLGLSYVCDATGRKLKYLKWWQGLNCHGKWWLNHLYNDAESSIINLLTDDQWQNVHMGC